MCMSSPLHPNTTLKWAISYTLQLLSSGKDSPVPIGQEILWNPNFVWTRWYKISPHPQGTKPQVPRPQLTQNTLYLWAYICCHISSINTRTKIILSQLNALFLLTNLLICSANFTSISMWLYACAWTMHTYKQWIKLSLISPQCWYHEKCNSWKMDCKHMFM
jgi:hypothetical protein